MKKPKPIRLLWTNSDRLTAPRMVMIPDERSLRLLAKELGEGEITEWERHESREMHRHRSYFWSVNEAWKNLPEGIADQYTSPNNLRYRLLIRLGFCTQRDLVFDTAHDAQVVAAYLAPTEENSIIIVKENTVRIFTAWSQAVGAMDAETFKETSRAVLDEIAAMIHVSVRELEKNAGQSA